MSMPDSLKLLLVEDDPAHARLFERTLRRRGIRNPIVHMGDGASALALLFAEADRADVGRMERLLIVLDLNMPGENGYEVLERLKADDRTCNIPVIVLTTTRDVLEVGRCRELGCDAVLIKPLDYHKFLGATQRLGLVLDEASGIAWGRET